MLRIAVPDLVSNSYFPIIAAVEMGFFKQEGFDASVDLLFPIPKTFEALRDGNLDFVVGSAHEGPLSVGSVSPTMPHTTPLSSTLQHNSPIGVIAPLIL